MSRPCSPRAWIVAAALLAALLSIFLKKPPTPGPEKSLPNPPLLPQEASRTPADRETSPAATPFGQHILSEFADPALPAERDVEALSRVLGNFVLLVKGDNPLPLGANEEIAAALRGKNRAQLRALPDDSRAFNARGQLVDRWGSPYYFHAQSRDRLDIRSAGPDRVMWTADDLHRMHDGRFLRGEALLAPSLFNPGRTQR